MDKCQANLQPFMFDNKAHHLSHMLPLRSTRNRSTKKMFVDTGQSLTDIGDVYFPLLEWPHQWSLSYWDLAKWDSKHIVKRGLHPRAWLRTPLILCNEVTAYGWNSNSNSNTIEEYHSGDLSRHRTLSINHVRYVICCIKSTTKWWIKKLFTHVCFKRVVIVNIVCWNFPRVVINIVYLNFWMSASTIN